MIERTNMKIKQDLLDKLTYKLSDSVTRPISTVSSQQTNKIAMRETHPREEDSLPQLMHMVESEL